MGGGGGNGLLGPGTDLGFGSGLGGLTGFGVFGFCSFMIYSLYN